MKKIFLFLILIFVGLVGNSQNKKAINQYNLSKNSFANDDYKSAYLYSCKAIEIDNNFTDAYYMAYNCAMLNKDTLNSIRILKDAKFNFTSNYTFCMLLADTYLKLYMLTDAINEYDYLLKNYSNIDQKTKNKAIENKELAFFRKNKIENPLDIDIKNLGPNINTKYNEYFPSVTADERFIIYTIELPQTGNNPFLPNSHEDIYIAYRKDKEHPWQQARSIGNMINTFNNEGASFISSDGNLLFYTSCTCPSGEIRCCDIYFAVNGPEGFSKPYKLPSEINTSYWESQPCMSQDGRRLFFVSNRPGGFGGKDIWYCDLLDDNTWSDAINCGEKINTPKDESSPFLHADNQTLYFSSNGLKGMGGQDLYKSTMIDGEFSSPINLGYPINTQRDEQRIVINAYGNTAYISSNKEDGKGFDLYSFDLPKEIAPKPIFVVIGNVLDSKTKQPLAGDYKIGLDTDKILRQNGNIPASYDNLLLFLAKEKDYALEVNSKGYLPENRFFSLKNLNDSIKEFRIDILLKKIEKNQSVVLENVFFDLDSYSIKKESYFELDNFAKFLKENPNLKIEISGHTDSRGSKEHNLSLSTNRAKAIVEYLKKQGVSNTLVYKGYGSQKPLDDRPVEEAYKKNRRTEAKILE